MTSGSDVLTARMVNSLACKLSVESAARLHLASAARERALSVAGAGCVSVPAVGLREKFALLSSFVTASILRNIKSRSLFIVAALAADEACETALAADEACVVALAACEACEIALAADDACVATLAANEACWIGGCRLWPGSVFSFFLILSSNELAWLRCSRGIPPVARSWPLILEKDGVRDGPSSRLGASALTPATPAATAYALGLEIGVASWTLERMVTAAAAGGGEARLALVRSSARSFLALLIGARSSWYSEMVFRIANNCLDWR